MTPYCWPVLLTVEGKHHAEHVLVHPMQLPNGRRLLQIEMLSYGDEGPDDERNAAVDLTIEQAVALSNLLVEAVAHLMRGGR